MDTGHPRPDPEGLVSQDDGGLWTKSDPNPDRDHKETPSGTYDGRPRDQTTSPPPPSAVITQQSGTDLDSDDVFTEHTFGSSPPCLVPLVPLDGSVHGGVNKSSVTFANGAADATEAEANPRGLHWHHGEKQLVAAQNELNESLKTSHESVDSTALSEVKKSSPNKTPMEGRMDRIGPHYDPPGGQHQGNSVLRVDPEGVEILSERQENWRRVGAENNNQPLSLEEKSDREVLIDKDGEGTKSDAPAETQMKIKASPGSSKKLDEDLKSCKNNQNKDTNQQEPKTASEECDDDEEEHVDTRSLNYELAKHDWVRRESGVSENLLTQLSISESSGGTMSKGEQENGSQRRSSKTQDRVSEDPPPHSSVSESPGDTMPKEEQDQGSKRISSNIQHGEDLLQRLQLVQKRHDVQVQENPLTGQQDLEETRGEGADVFGMKIDFMPEREDVVEREESVCQPPDDGARREEQENPEGDGSGGKAWLSPLTLSVNPDHHPISRTESGESDDYQSSVWKPEWSSIDEMSTNQSPLVSSRPRLSVAETSLEKQIHEVAQKKQNLQRAGGVFNLSDNLDVIEIPFKTSFSLEPLPGKVPEGQCVEWKFSKHKMQKEINQEIQRELVMVNQGKIPGAYSKGEIRQLKETNLLFESFQQDNMEGPTRHRKSPTSPRTKGHVYPSVLERTRSLEMFSLKNFSISKPHPATVQEPSTFQMKQRSEDFRSKSPNGGPRDKSRSFPYPKQDKHTRLYKSMDLISTGASSVETRIRIIEENMSNESPIVKQNPFFKLRPALVLQPEVEKDIREAREREEELRRQRCSLYGEQRWKNSDKEKSRLTPVLTTDISGPSRGKLERSWPPPSKKEHKWEQMQQEAKVRRTGGQKASLWQRWESGQINGQPPKDKD